MTKNASILVINGGSSSIKFALFQIEPIWKRLYSGKVERIGIPDPKLVFSDNEKKEEIIDLNITDHSSASNFLIEFIKKQKYSDTIEAIGHRVVHGMNHIETQLISAELLNDLKKFSSLDPNHLPHEILLMEIFIKKFPKLTQIACFDTYFHRTLPRVASIQPIPRRFEQKGIKRYGFHGISYAYLLEEYSKISKDIPNKKIIIAHLGSGASIAAIKGEKCIDTSMAFTPSSGIPMGSRTGDLDPGIITYLMKSENLSYEQINTLINNESGLKGISETSSDMRDLLKIKREDIRAAEAIDHFCYQTLKYIGAYTAALGGLDVLIFSGGIGENIPEIRMNICSQLQYLGLEINPAANLLNESLISEETSRVEVRVKKTDEEKMIAKMVNQLINIDKT